MKDATMKKPLLSRKNKKTIKKIIFTIIALILSLILTIPFVWMVICSFQESPELIFANPPVMPNIFKVGFKNYALAFETIDMWRMIKNTLIIVFWNLILSVTSSVLVAYGFARSRVKEKGVFFAILLSTMMLPWVVTLVPSYIIYSKIGWVGTRLPLILPAIGGNAFYIFLLRQFFMGIPRELDEAAEIDGCNKVTTLFRILLPQAKPVIATIVVFSFVGTWSDYVGPRIYLASSPELQTLSVGLNHFRSQSSAMPWHAVMAACVIFTIPMVFTMYISQKQFTEGIVTSGIKG